MTATPAMIAQVRRWTNEATAEHYTDDALQALIEQFPKVDERGIAPYWYDTATDPPTQVATVGWYPTYDLHAAAAVVWEDKAALLAETVDRPTQGPTPGVHRETQPRDYALAQARYHKSRSSAKNATLVAWPSRRSLRDTVWIGNLAERDDFP